MSDEPTTYVRDGYAMVSGRRTIADVLFISYRTGISRYAWISDDGQIFVSGISDFPRDILCGGDRPWNYQRKDWQNQAIPVARKWCGRGGQIVQETAGGAPKMSVLYAYWKAALAGQKPEANPDNPQPGFYRTKRGTGWVPVAVWPKGNGLTGPDALGFKINRETVGANMGAELWSHYCAHPITEAVYRAVAERGENWPDAGESKENPMHEIIRWTPDFRVTRPCIVSGMPIDVYHGDCTEGPSVSSSGLRTITGESPADFWDKSYLNSESEPQEETKSLIMGRAVHHLILGQEKFSESFVIQPETYFHSKEKATKPWSNLATDCKNWNAAQKQAGRSILTPSDAETIRGMAKSIARDEMARAGLLNGLTEHSIFWKDKTTGLWCKIRPDTIPVLNIAGASADIVDLKTIESVVYEDCSRAYQNYALFQQAALIRQGLKEVLNISVSTFTLFFVEKKRPFSTRPMLLKDADMDLGDQANRVALDVMHHCLLHKTWPGPGRGPGRDLIEYLGLSDAGRERIDASVQRLRDTFELRG